MVETFTLIASKASYAIRFKAVISNDKNRKWLWTGRSLLLPDAQPFMQITPTFENPKNLDPAWSNRIPRWATLLQISHEARCTLYLSNDIMSEQFLCCMHPLALHRAQNSDG
jgi:hypothetical protein